MADVKRPPGPLARLFGWARASSLVALPFIGSVNTRLLAPWLEWATATRLGRAPGSASPSQADLLVVVGDVSHKVAPVLQRTHANMAHPSFVVHVGGTLVEGPPVETYATVARLTEILSVDVVIEGAPPDEATVAAGIRALERRVRERRS